MISYDLLFPKIFSFSFHLNFIFSMPEYRREYSKHLEVASESAKQWEQRRELMIWLGLLNHTGLDQRGCPWTCISKRANPKWIASHVCIVLAIVTLPPTIIAIVRSLPSNLNISQMLILLLALDYWYAGHA